MSHPPTAPNGRDARDLYPLTTDFESARAVRSSSRIARDLIDEAPDVDRSWFDTDEDFQAWVAEGCLRFFEVI